MKTSDPRIEGGFIQLRPHQRNDNKLKSPKFNELLIHLPENSDYLFRVSWWSGQWFTYQHAVESAKTVLHAIDEFKSCWIRRPYRDEETESEHTAYNNPRYPMPKDLYLEFVMVKTNGEFMGERRFNSHNQFRNWESRLRDQIWRGGGHL